MTLNPARSVLYAFAALAIYYTSVSPAQAAQNSCSYINSSGRRIPTVFYALRPDTQFAKVLGREVISLRRQKSVPHFRNLVFHGVCPKSLLGKAAFPQGDGSCYGQYMQATLTNCCITLPCNCAPPYDYDVFNSTGCDQCHGYYVVGDACNGCELDEQGCASCTAGY